MYRSVFWTKLVLPGKPSDFPAPGFSFAGLMC